MKTKRHAKILEIIRSRAIDTQEGLQKALRDNGFEVTQATVSRDIKELHLIKTMVDGAYRYTTVRQEADAMSTKFHTLFADTVRSIDFAANLVVVKCLPGMAQAACAAMDAMQWQSVMGTLAGEDTFICITKSEDMAISLAAELKKVLRNG